MASASVPQGEGAPKDLAGTWKVRFGVYGASAKPKLKGTVRVQSSGDGTFHGGQLDLHIHVPSGLRIPGRTVDASKAKSDPDLEERVETFFALTTQLLGIEKGEVVFHEESSSCGSSTASRALLKGFAVSKGQKDGTQALHILMTNLIADNGQPFAAGVAPGIPGAATVFGRNVSGIIVTTSRSAERDVLRRCSKRRTRPSGLNHTHRVRRSDFDPLITDTPARRHLARAALQLPDRTNVMFAAGAMDGPVSLSPSQKRVYRGSPIYRAFPAGGGTKICACGSLDAVVQANVPRLGQRCPVANRARARVRALCGLNALDADGLVKRHGRVQAIAQLKAAAVDADLAPYIRGRANLALRALNAQWPAPFVEEIQIDRGARPRSVTVRSEARFELEAP